MKLRLVSTLFIALISLIFAIYMAYRWFNHGMPIYTAAYRPGGEPEILPILSFALMSFVIFCVAMIDFYMHTNNEHEPKKPLTKNQKRQRHKNRKRYK